MKDAVGVPFAASQVITYPGRKGSYLFVNTGVVLAVEANCLVVERLEVQWTYRPQEHGGPHYTVKAARVFLSETQRATVTTLSERAFRAQLQAEAEQANARLRERYPNARVAQ